MTTKKAPEKRYINDLRRFAFGQEQFLNFKGVLVPIGLAIIFLAAVGLITASSQAQFGEHWLLVVIAAVIVDDIIAICIFDDFTLDCV